MGLIVAVAIVVTGQDAVQGAPNSREVLAPMWYNFHTWLFYNFQANVPHVYGPKRKRLYLP